MLSIDLLRERISELHNLDDSGTIKEEIYAEDSFKI